mgnify:CR=1 FL=1
MRHKIKLTVKEKINAWLDLCDFSFLLMKSTLNEKALIRKIDKINFAHAERNKLILKGLANVR